MTINMAFPRFLETFHRLMLIDVVGSNTVRREIGFDPKFRLIGATA
jgi:hypothetical protein